MANSPILNLLNDLDGSMGTLDIDLKYKQMFEQMRFDSQLLEIELPCLVKSPLNRELVIKNLNEYALNTAPFSIIVDFYKYHITDLIKLFQESIKVIKDSKDEISRNFHFIVVIVWLYEQLKHFDIRYTPPSEWDQDAIAEYYSFQNLVSDVRNLYLQYILKYGINSVSGDVRSAYLNLFKHKTTTTIRQSKSSLYFFMGSSSFPRLEDELPIAANPFGKSSTLQSSKGNRPLGSYVTILENPIYKSEKFYEVLYSIKGTDRFRHCIFVGYGAANETKRVRSEEEVNIPLPKGAVKLQVEWTETNGTVISKRFSDSELIDPSLCVNKCIYYLDNGDILVELKPFEKYSIDISAIEDEGKEEILEYLSLYFCLVADKSNPNIFFIESESSVIIEFTLLATPRIMQIVGSQINSKDAVLYKRDIKYWPIITKKLQLTDSPLSAVVLANIPNIGLVNVNLIFNNGNGIAIYDYKGDRYLIDESATYLSDDPLSQSNPVVFKSASFREPQKLIKTKEGEFYIVTPDGLLVYVHGLSVEIIEKSQKAKHKLSNLVSQIDKDLNQKITCIHFVDGNSLDFRRNYGAAKVDSVEIKDDKLNIWIGGKLYFFEKNRIIPVELIGPVYNQDWKILGLGSIKANGIIADIRIDNNPNRYYSASTGNIYDLNGDIIEGLIIVKLGESNYDLIEPTERIFIDGKEFNITLSNKTPLIMIDGIEYYFDNLNSQIKPKQVEENNSYKIFAFVNYSKNLTAKSSLFYVTTEIKKSENEVYVRVDLTSEYFISKSLVKSTIQFLYDLNLNLVTNKFRAKINDHFHVFNLREGEKFILKNNEIFIILDNQEYKIEVELGRMKFLKGDLGEILVLSILDLHSNSLNNQNSIRTYLKPISLRTNDSLINNPLCRIESHDGTVYWLSKYVDVDGIIPSDVQFFDVNGKEANDLVVLKSQNEYFIFSSGKMVCDNKLKFISNSDGNLIFEDLLNNKYTISKIPEATEFVYLPSEENNSTPHPVYSLSGVLLGIILNGELYTGVLEFRGTKYYGINKPSNINYGAIGSIKKVFFTTGAGFESTFSVVDKSNNIINLFPKSFEINFESNGSFTILKDSVEYLLEDETLKPKYNFNEVCFNAKTFEVSGFISDESFIPINEFTSISYNNSTFYINQRLGLVLTDSFKKTEDYIIVDTSLVKRIQIIDNVEYRYSPEQTLYIPAKNPFGKVYNLKLKQVGIITSSGSKIIDIKIQGTGNNIYYVEDERLLSNTIIEKAFSQDGQQLQKGLFLVASHLYKNPKKYLLTEIVDLMNNPPDIVLKLKAFTFPEPILFNNLEIYKQQNVDSGYRYYLFDKKSGSIIAEVVELSSEKVFLYRVDENSSLSNKYKYNLTLSIWDIFE